MYTIQLSEGSLEVYPQDIEWSFETVRFSGGLRDAFTSDFTLPKTQNNLALLECAGLLDSRQQPLGDLIEPCAFNIGSKVFSAYIQVVSVEEETITICLYEKLIPGEILDCNVAELLRDTCDDIFVWNVNTQGAYPGSFKKYQYSVTNGINPNYAQLHPSKPLGEALRRISQAAGINMPAPPSNRYLIATKKTVSPQNKIQVIEGHWTSDSGNFAVLSGGQHVTNDLEFSYSPDQTAITFNRDCKVSGRVYCSWKKKPTVTNSFHMYICRYRASAPAYAPAYTLNSSTYASEVGCSTFSAAIKAGDTLRVQCDDTDKYDMLNFVLVFEYSDYGISDDDYGTELKYVGRTPRLTVWTDNGTIRYGNRGWQSAGSGNGCYTALYFDGTAYGYYRHRTGSPGTLYPAFINLEWCSLAYFGYWQNLPDMTVKELMWGLCWAEGCKLISTHERNGSMLYPVLQYVPAQDAAVIDGHITQTRISSDRLGRKNYILCAGQEKTGTQPISEIENKWLEKEKALHESPFAYSMPEYGQWYCIPQYSDFSYDSGSGEYKAKFNDIDGVAIANVGSVSSMLYKFELNCMDFGRMVQSIEVDIETYNDIKGLDFVFLEGRKYMVVEGSANLESGYSTVKAILVPYSEEYAQPDRQSPQPAENRYEDDREQTYRYDPNDDFDGDDDHSGYEPWDGQGGYDERD